MTWRRADGWSRRLVLWICLAACLAKGVAALVVIPPFQTPDEYGHYDYVLYLSYIDVPAFVAGATARPTGYNDVTTDELWFVTRVTGTESHLRGPGLQRPLPRFAEQWSHARTFVPSDTHERLRKKTIVAPQFNYPVLYYGSLAGLTKVLRSMSVNPLARYHIARACSLLMVLLTVYLFWRAVLIAWPGISTRGLALGTGFVALQPQLTLLGSAVQSDTLAVLLVTASLVPAARYARRGAIADVVVLGLLTGALLLTKLHTACAVGAAGLALVSWKAAGDVSWRRGVRHALVLAGVAAVIGAWWYVRSYVLFGSYTGMVGEFRAQPFGTPRQNLTWWLDQYPLMWNSFWGMWGWLEVPLPIVFYRAFAVLTVVTALTLLSSVGLPMPAEKGRIAFPLYLAALAGAYAALMVTIAIVIGPAHNNQGRHWLPIIGVAASCLILSMRAGPISRRRRVLEHAALIAWTATLIAANVSLLLRTAAFYR